MSKYSEMKMVCRLFLLFCCVMQLQLASAQSAELQQLVLNVEKLAQLKKILSGMKSTYQIIVKGYDRIKSLTEGNFSIHEVFLDALLKISPEVRRYRKIYEAVKCQVTTVKACKSFIGRINSSRFLSASEKVSIIAGFSEFLKACIQNIDELSLVLSPGVLRMSDEERILVIDRIYVDSKDILYKALKHNRSSGRIEQHRMKLSMEAISLIELYK